MEVGTLDGDIQYIMEVGILEKEIQYKLEVRIVVELSVQNIYPNKENNTCILIYTC